MSHQASMGRICLLVVENAQSHASVGARRAAQSRCRRSRRRARAQSAAARPAFAESGAGIAAHGGAGDCERAALLARPAHRRSDCSVCRASTACSRRSESGCPDAVHADVADPCVQRRRAGSHQQALCSRARVGCLRRRTARHDLGARSRDRRARLALPAARRASCDQRRGSAWLQHPRREASSSSRCRACRTERSRSKATASWSGRGEEADVSIDSVFVSRYHALIVHDNGQDLLLDLGSTNGLLVNSRRILRRALRHRDLIQVGPARVMYFNEHAAATAQPDPGETICFARPGFPARGRGRRGRRAAGLRPARYVGLRAVGLKPDLQRATGACA